MSETATALSPRREAIRKEIEADPSATNTAIAKRLNAARDTVIAVRKSMAGTLVTSRYEAMCTAIAECAAVDEVKDMRDKAMALQVYAQQAQNFEAERKAQEIRVRAERRAGELLKAMPKAKPSGGDRKSAEFQASRESRLDPQPGTLHALGISHNQSSQWQQLANVPQETFEAAIADTDEPLSAGRIIERHDAATQPAPVPAEPVEKVDKRAIHLWGTLRDTVDDLEDIDLAEVIAVTPDYLLDEVFTFAAKLAGVMRTILEIEEKNHD
jgi:hypothetical protein